MTVFACIKKNVMASDLSSLYIPAAALRNSSGVRNERREADKVKVHFLASPRKTRQSQSQTLLEPRIFKIFLIYKCHQVADKSLFPIIRS